eukprot:6464268-Amphidinium_carterae.2
MLCVSGSSSRHVAEEPHGVKLLICSICRQFSSEPHGIAKGQNGGQATSKPKCLGSYSRLENRQCRVDVLEKLCEDAIAGFCDDRQYLCLGLAMWNGKDPILKERLFGLTNPQGNHGEEWTLVPCSDFLFSMSHKASGANIHGYWHSVWMNTCD